MLVELVSNAAYAYPGWGHGPGAGGPGWWLIFPILFWVLVLSAIGYVIYRRSPKQRHEAPPSGLSRSGTPAARSARMSCGSAGTWSGPSRDSVSMDVLRSTSVPRAIRGTDVETGND